MPYNVTLWKTKELSDLRIPFLSLFKSEQTDWHPDRSDLDNGMIKFSLGEFSVVGTIKDDWFHVASIHGSGEFSGKAMKLFLEPALADSRGRLVASRVWEGGDSIDRLTVVDGVVTAEPIEI